MHHVSEEQLSAAFATLMKGRTATGSTLPALPLLLAEFEALQGRADYVGASCAVAELRQAAAEGWGRLFERPATARVYRYLPTSAPRTLKFFTGRTGLTVATVRACLRALVQGGLADETPSGCFVRAAKRLPSPEVWAFEVKVCDWRRALYQALQYQAFAHRVAVVIAGEFAHRAAAQVQLFRKLGVGLWVIENLQTAPTLRRVAAPRRRSPSSGTYHLHALGRLIASA